jgi:transposase-like protein
MFLSELREKHRVDDVTFLIDGAPWLQAAYHRHGPDSNTSHIGIGMPLDVSFMKQNDEQTNSQIRSATPSRVPLKIGYKRSPSHGISLSKHYPGGNYF